MSARTSLRIHMGCGEPLQSRSWVVQPRVSSSACAASRSKANAGQSAFGKEVGSGSSKRKPSPVRQEDNSES